MTKTLRTTPHAPCTPNWMQKAPAERALKEEISLFASVLESLQKALTDHEHLPDVTRNPGAGNEKNLWIQVRVIVQDCQSTILELYRMLMVIKDPKQSQRPSIFNLIQKQVKMDWKSNEIDAERQKLASYRGSLQTLLQIIILFVLVHFLLLMRSAHPFSTNDCSMLLFRPDWILSCSL